MPKAPKKNSSTASAAPVNARSRNLPRFSIGCGQRSSQATKAASPAAATTAAVMALRPQPKCGPSMIMYTRAPTVTIDSSPPSTSGRPVPSARDGGTSTSAARIATAATGRLIRNVECQEWLCSSHPAVSGPRAMARPEVADHAVMARARSARGKVATSSDSVAGMMTAAPVPMTARGDDRRDAVRSEAGHRAGAEDQQAGDQRPAPAELVADRAQRSRARLLGACSGRFRYWVVARRRRGGGWGWGGFLVWYSRTDWLTCATTSGWRR